jgi:hypothetical protein
MQYRDSSDEVTSRAQQIVEAVETAARKQNGELVLDQLEDLFELSDEFPETAWKACARLARSPEPAVRIAMATRGVPEVYNRISPHGAEQLTRWLLEDANPEVADAMRASLANLPD